VTTPRQTAAKMAEAAQAWLERLEDEQRPAAQWAGPADEVSEAERRRWFYTPTDHGGLTVHQQRPAQQRAAMTLVVELATRISGLNATNSLAKVSASGALLAVQR